MSHFGHLRRLSGCRHVPRTVSFFSPLIHQVLLTSVPDPLLKRPVLVELFDNVRGPAGNPPCRDDRCAELDRQTEHIQERTGIKIRIVAQPLFAEHDLFHPFAQHMPAPVSDLLRKRFAQFLHDPCACGFVPLPETRDTPAPGKRVNEPLLSAVDLADAPEHRHGMFVRSVLKPALESSDRCGDRGIIIH